MRGERRDGYLHTAALNLGPVFSAACRRQCCCTQNSAGMYCRLKGIESTGSLVSDIHRANFG